MHGKYDGHASNMGATEIRKESDLANALDRLSAAHTALDEALTRLRGKLEPVLLPENPTPKAKSAVETNSSPTVNTLRAAADYARALERHARDLVSRLAL